MIDYLLDMTYEKLCRLGMKKISGLEYLDEKSWHAAKQWWADNGQERWVPIPWEFAHSIINDAAKEWWLSMSLHEDPDQSNRVTEDCEWASVGRYDPEHERAGDDGFVYFNGPSVAQAAIVAFLGERKEAQDEDEPVMNPT